MSKTFVREVAAVLIVSGAFVGACGEADEVAGPRRDPGSSSAVPGAPGADGSAIGSDGGSNPPGTLPDGAPIEDGATPGEDGGAVDGGAVDGGGGNDSSTPAPDAGPPAAVCPTGPAIPAFTLSGVYYFSNCAAGAAASCVAGDNANAGTSPAAPKRDLTGFNVNTLPAGTQLRFARGGAWENVHVVLQNFNATPTSPIVFEPYTPSTGATAPPWFKTAATAIAFEFGTYQQDATDDGGYVIRGLKVDGQGVGQWGFWMRAVLRNVLIEDIELTGFQIGIHTQSLENTAGVRFLTIRNSNIHHNSSMGMLGSANDFLIEGNTIANNNFSGSGFEHGIYLGGGGSRGILRNNAFTNNSVVGGTCTGGNLTVHGRWDNITIEGNTITQAASAGGCYGISLNPGYASAEYLRNFVVRGNTVVNLGFCAICASSAPGIVIDSNLVVNTQSTYQAGVIVGGDIGPGDDADTAGIVRNNTVYFTQAGSGSEGVSMRATSGQNLRVVSNLVYFGAGSNPSHHCFGHTALSNFTTFANNLCHHAGSGGDWSPTYATLAAAQAAGFDVGGSSAAPAFVAAPSAGNGYSCQLTATSPAVNTGHPTASSPVDRNCAPRTDPDIGACER